MTYIPKHRGEPVVKYRVHYVESERGWGSNEFHSDFDTPEEATRAIKSCNAGNIAPYAPDCYIMAMRDYETIIL